MIGYILLVLIFPILSIVGLVLFTLTAPHTLLADVWAQQMLPAFAILSILSSIGAIIILLLARRSGTLLWMSGQKPNKALVLYISPSRRIIPLQATEYLSKHLVLDDKIGRFFITENSDYIMHGKKVYIARSHVGHTIPVDMAKYTEQLAKAGWKMVKLEEKEEEVIQ